MDAALMTEATDFRIVLRQSSLVVLLRGGIPLEANFRVGFTVNEPQPAIGKRRVHFLSGQNLNHRDIEIEGAQQIEPLLVRWKGHQEVGNQDRLSRPA